MASLVERLLIQVDAKTGGAVRDIDRVQRSVDGVGTSATGAQSRLDRFSARVGVSSAAMKAGLATAATTAGIALVRFGVDAAQSSSAVREQINSVQVTFKGAADSVIAFSKTTADGLGIARSEALRAATGFGSMFTGIGIGEAQAAQLSIGLTQLAGDLASLRDLSTDDAVTKLMSGLAGETEPLRRLGVDLSAAAVEAEATRLGFRKLGGEFSEAQKRVVRAKLAMDELKVAQGDAANTADSLANVQRRSAAAFEDLKASVGGTAEVIGGTFGTALLNVKSIMDGLSGGKESGLPSWMRNPLSAIPLTQGLVLFNEAMDATGSNTERVNQSMSVYDATLSTINDLVKQGQQGTLAFAQAQQVAKSAVDGLSSSIMGAANARMRVGDATARMENSERGLVDSRKQLNDLLRRGAVDAEEVARATRSAEQANRSLAHAQQRAAELQQRVNELRNPSGDTQEERAIALARAQQRVLDAEKAVFDLRYDATRTASDEANAELALREARLALSREQQRGAEDARVLSDAERQLADANYDVQQAQFAAKDAAQKLAEARSGDKDWADKVAAAKRGVRDAERELTQARYDAVQAIVASASASSAERDALSAAGGAAGALRAQIDGIAAQYPQLKPLFDQLFGGVGVGGTKVVDGRNPNTSGLGSKPIPRAGGGQALAGQTYLVGDNGPEVLSMGPNSGFVTPRGGGGGNTYQVSVTVQNGTGPEVERAVLEAIRSFEYRSGKSWRN